MSLKDLIFQKGGIGVSMTREETVAHLNPLIKHHMELNHAHNYVIAHVTEPDVADQLGAFQKVARVDVGKLMETVFSAGGVAYNGVDLEPDAFNLGAGDDEMLFALRDAEQALQDALGEDLAQPHQIRTQAVLNRLRANSLERLQYLKDLTRRRRRPVSSTT